MTDPKSTPTKRGRPPSGSERAQTLREAKVRYRVRLKEHGKVTVTLPISQDANLILKESATSAGKSATALMTELLEDAAKQWARANTTLNSHVTSASPE